jgi:hypothetical protein
MPTTVVTLQFRDGVLVDPDPAVFRTFTPGTTTADEVRAAARAPVMRNVLPDRTEAWTYVFGSTGTTSTVKLVPGWRARADRSPGKMTDHLSADLAAFLEEHERCGELDTGHDRRAGAGVVTCT